MNNPLTATPISPLRQRLIDDMNVRRFSPETQRDYIRDVLLALMWKPKMCAWFQRTIRRTG